MKSILMAGAALALAGCATTLPETPVAIADEITADVAFERLTDQFLHELGNVSPLYATYIGDHSHDGELAIPGIEERNKTRIFAQTYLAALKTIDFKALGRENQVDYLLLRNELESTLWSQDTLKSWQWDPQVYSNGASGALYSLVARDFAPFVERYPDIVSRMELLPAYLAASRQQLDVARVPKVHAETVARQAAGLMEIVDGMIAPQVAESGVDSAPFEAAREKLAAAMDEHQTWLDEVLVPGAEGDFRLGTELYDQKMRFGLMSEMSRTELKARAEAAYEDARTEMEEVARTIEGCDVEGQQAAIECALELSYERRASRATVEEEARGTLATATAFTQAEGFVTMPDSDVQIITMPKFQQGAAVAYLDSPAPLEKHLPAFYAVSPIPEDWSEEQATSFLKEYNWYMLHELSIHEGVPGHYLQINLSNKFPSTIRSVLGSSPFVEGWAVYSERLMAEHEYLGGMRSMDGKLFRLTMLKMRLRSIINTLLDIGIQTEGMNRDEAMELMMTGGFQQEREAAGKWVRANLSSVQLLSYFTGYSEHLALREEAKQRWGAEYDERKYHDAVLSHGSPPAKFVRELVFDLPIEE